MPGLIGRLSRRLLTEQLRLVTAESCTGGLIASRCTAMEGSSEWFEGAFVTYRPAAKQAMVGVSALNLDRYTAVSEPVAREMAEGALQRTSADVSISVTGIAGPGGGDIITPVGTVWFAWARRRGAEIECLGTDCECFQGNRDSVRASAVEFAINGLLKLLDESRPDLVPGDR